MRGIRTDLAAEARDLWRESAGETGALPGVEAVTETAEGFPVETIRILDERGEKALGRRRGSYVTIELDPVLRHESGALGRGCAVIAERVRALLGLRPGDGVLVAGLGNRAVTPDVLGPRTLECVLATRHLVRSLPETFGSLRSVSLLETGVLGSTGLESSELIRAVTRRLRPAAVIAVDALASRGLERVCRTLQICDTGIAPGSGVGNSRPELSRETLGVPVLALGIPTVVDAATLAADLTARSGLGERDPEDFAGAGAGLMVTPREIDQRMRELSRLLGYGLDLALQEGLTLEDVLALLG
jgi:spore protease